jgi:hypothetical protein
VHGKREHPVADTPTSYLPQEGRGESFDTIKRKTGEKKAHHQVRSNSGHVSGRLAMPTTSVKRGVSSNVLR